MMSLVNPTRTYTCVSPSRLYSSLTAPASRTPFKLTIFLMIQPQAEPVALLMAAYERLGMTALLVAIRQVKRREKKRREERRHGGTGAYLRCAL